MAPTLLESDRMQETIRARILELQEMEARHHQLNAMIHSFSQELGFSAQQAAERIPTQEFRNRYPHLFIRAPIPSSALPPTHQMRPSPQIGRRTPPNERYDHTNPLWEGQNAHYKVHGTRGTMAWYSTITPREVYRHYQCSLCKLFGHIQYNCPKYACPHCHRACGCCPDKCRRNPDNQDGRNNHHIGMVLAPPLRMIKKPRFDKLKKEQNTQGNRNNRRGRGRANTIPTTRGASQP